jgi:hypothetical protein
VEDSIRGSEHNDELARRAADSPGGIAATVVAWQRSADGGTVARLRFSDGERLGWLEVGIPPGAMLPFGSAIEWAVEELAATLPPDARFDALERRSPLTWTDGGLAG